MRTCRRRTSLLTLPAMLASCAPGDSAPGGATERELLVSVRGGEVIAADSIESGWHRVRVEEERGGHILVAFRLLDSSADTAAFLQELDSSSATPRSALALGGPEVGTTGEVVIRFTPGHYLLGCVRRGRDGHRHAARGEAKVIVVSDGPGASATVEPVATERVGMVDFAYLGTDRWAAGAHMLRVANRGPQDHQLRIARMHEGSSLRDWMDAEEPADHATPIAGVARLGAGALAYLPVDLPPGVYVFFCLVSDAHSGKPHTELGMFREIRVEAREPRSTPASRGRPPDS